MKFLAVDLSLDNFNIIIGNEEKIIYSQSMKLSKNREKRLFDSLNFMKDNKVLDFKNLDAIYATIGPGNFNGIRIAISAIKAFALVNKSIKISGVSSFDALVRSYKINSNVCVALKSSPGFVYSQCFDLQFKYLSNVEVYNLENEYQLPVTRTNLTFIGNASEILSDKFDCKGLVINKNLITTNGLFSAVKNLIHNDIHIDATPIYLKNTNIAEPSSWKRSPIV